MGKYLSIFLLFSLIILLNLAFSPKIYSQSYDSVYTKEIAPGIVHKRLVSLKDTILANVLKIDLKKGNYFIKAAKANNYRAGRKKTTEMAASHVDSGLNIIAAINADFFNLKTGEVENNMIIEGEFLKAITVGNSRHDKVKSIFSQFAFTYDNRPLINRFLFKGELILKDKQIIKINKINSEADSNSITLYNHYQGAATPELPESWTAAEYEIIPVRTSSDTMLFVVGKRFDQKGNNPVRNDALILSANNLIAALLQDKIYEKDTLRIIMKMLPDRHKIRTLVGGRAAIVSNGRNLGRDIQWIEGISPSFSWTKHPRTGVGYNEDGTVVYFIVVDGRQQSSRGATLEAFAELMINEGVYEGLNLDGGGSTTMVINGNIVNHPSDKGGERTVANCLLLIQDKISLSGEIR